MKTPEEWCDTENKQVWLEPDFIRSVQSDARADLEAENKALNQQVNALIGRCKELAAEIMPVRERAKKAEAQLTHVLICLDEGTLPYWQKKHDDLLAKWFKAEIENKALLERAESAEASFKERDLQMKAALEETESMFQRTQRAETNNIELRERLKKAEADLAKMTDLMEHRMEQRDQAEAACAESKKAMLSALCDPEGVPCFAGSDGDRAVIAHALSSTCGQPLLDRMRAMEEILKDCQHLRSQVFPLACFPECPACRWEALNKATA